MTKIVKKILIAKSKVTDVCEFLVLSDQQSKTEDIHFTMIQYREKRQIPTLRSCNQREYMACLLEKQQTINRL